jgi:hypothetical protein
MTTGSIGSQRTLVAGRWMLTDVVQGKPFGHPGYPPFVHFPSALLPVALIFDVVFRLDADLYSHFDGTIFAIEDLQFRTAYLSLARNHIRPSSPEDFEASARRPTACPFALRRWLRAERYSSGAATVLPPATSAPAAGCLRHGSRCP